MAISLQKGGNVNLSKEAPGMKKMLVGLGWSLRATDGDAFDLDGSAFLLGAGDKVRSDADFVFYNQNKSSDGSVVHSGDNRTGEGEGDDETITVELDKVPADVEKIAVCVTIHDAEARRQNFGMVSRAYVRCVDAITNAEVARYDLSEDASVEAAMVFGEIYRHNGEWKFKAMGQGFQGGLGPMAKNFGVNA
ncbi:MAG: TerD family protein [Giesbergeria sp.]|jgi:tellurium resistance protein TerD|nr:TerD family protein [Giesbergeria sp.]MBP6374830.1 TerD family protein [Giesbergeria sp.]MBP7916436.1 TerD family protein [Giesbergeria sp.]MBP8029159.1 TerD family protein [Giesbergeria sp.]MBP8840115.1 TerD family protein [Giesbergeria sp.]